MSFKGRRQGWKFLFGSAGFLFFIYLVWKIGFGTVLESLAHFGVWFGVIVLVGASWLFFQACAWSLIQNAYFHKVPFMRLFRVRIIADAFNILLPSASLGGDAVRAYMIKKDAPLKEGIACVLFDKTIEFAASTVFLAVGLLLGVLFIRMPEGMLAPTLICLVLTAAGIVLLVFFSIRGFYGLLFKFSGILPAARRWVIKRESQLLALEENVRLLYRKGSMKLGTLAAAVGLHLLARLAGTIEILIILRVLGLPVDFVQAFFILTVVVISNTIFFILPGQWGITESASILVMQSLGYPAAAGLSLSVIRRIRKLAFVALALVFFVSGKEERP